MLSKIDKIDRIVSILSLSGVAVAACGLCTQILLVVLYIFVRDVVKGQWVFVEEWSGYLLVMMVFFTHSFTLRSRRHIRLELVANRLSWKAAAVCRVFCALAGLGIVVFLMQGAISWWLYTWTRKIVFAEVGTFTLQWIPYTFVLIGLSLFILAMVMEVVREIQAVSIGALDKEANSP